jgi:hypothetical protein
VVLIARTKKVPTELFSNLKAEAKRVYKNKDKTKYKHIKREHLSNIPLHINNFFFEKVCNFRYLVSTLNEITLYNLKFLKEFVKKFKHIM